MQQLHIKLGHSGCLWRQSQPRLSCFVIRAEGTSAEKSRDAVAERIAKARQYRELAKGQSQLGSSATQAQQQQPAAQVADAPEKLLAHGDSHASRQEQQLLAAVNEIRNAPERSTSSQDEAAIGKSSQSAQQPKPQAASYAKQASAQSSTQPQGVPPAPAQPAKRLSKADMLAKITQARAYKQEKQAKGGVGSPDIVQVSVTKADPAAQQQASPSSAALSQPKDSFSATQRRTASREADSSQANEPHEQQQTEHEGVGSATQAAGFLQQAVKGKDGSKGMRLETYSMLKEQEMRNQKVEIISVDKSYSTDKKVMDPNYNPKVATWGVFKRPANISEAYGGGRTIRAGTPLEDAAATQARKDRIAAALSRFKRDAGTQVDPAVQQACEKAFAEGEQLFRNKLVAAALTKYAAAAELLPVRTDLGGRARLQKAICLDSLGQNKEAYAVYSQIERHPNGDVAKQAKRMLFGFRAMDNLKAHTISYSVTKGAYDKYFNSLSGDWNAAYVSNDEDTTELNKVIFLASAVILAPLVFLAAKILL